MRILYREPLRPDIFKQSVLVNRRTGSARAVFLKKRTTTGSWDAAPRLLALVPWRSFGFEGVASSRSSSRAAASISTGNAPPLAPAISWRLRIG